MFTPQNRCLIYWRLLLSGFRSVWMNASDKPSKPKIRFVSRDLVPSDRATCTIASRVNFLNSKKKLVAFEVWKLRESLRNIFIWLSTILSNIYCHFHDSDILIRRIGGAPWQSDPPRVDSSTSAACKTTVHKLPLHFSTRSCPDSHTNLSVLVFPFHINQITITRHNGCWILPRD